MRLVFVVFAFFLVAVPACAELSKAPSVTSPRQIRAERVSKGLDRPWGLAFLPNGRGLVTEKVGRLRFVNGNGRLSDPIAGVPEVVADGQGGLLDVAVAPDFATSSMIYLSFSEARGEGKNGTSVARAVLVSEGKGGRLENLEIIFRQEPAKESNLHLGSRLVFMPDGSLFVTMGERAYFPNEAQNPDNDLGKIVRILPDGRPYPGNPKLPGWRPEIWSIGHRNVQGAAINPASGKLWTVELGAMGGDEVNCPEPGKNYGWPIISYGLNYDGQPIGEGNEKEGLEQPIYYWDPAISPSGAVFYTGDKMPEWSGNLFVAALSGQSLHRLVLEGNKVVGEEILLSDLNQRIRTVRMGPDGYLWVLTDSTEPWGEIYRVVPKPKA